MQQQKHIIMGLLHTFQIIGNKARVIKVTDEFYLCNQCQAPEPGWKSMFKFNGQIISQEQLNHLPKQDIIKAQQIQVCNKCHKESKALMFASWGHEDNDNMETARK